MGLEPTTSQLLTEQVVIAPPIADLSFLLKFSGLQYLTICLQYDDDVLRWKVGT